MYEGSEMPQDKLAAYNLSAMPNDSKNILRSVDTVNLVFYRHLGLIIIIYFDNK